MKGQTLPTDDSQLPAATNVDDSDATLQPSTLSDIPEESTLVASSTFIDSTRSPLRDSPVFKHYYGATTAVSSPKSISLTPVSKTPNAGSAKKLPLPPTLPKPSRKVVEEALSKASQG